ncbi:hypothetical protein MIMGU_mgv1a023000mg [Erythranthe guttata]|uniref:Uncharacterized protein n=1 Tax=Erythranthe guttata TaxID=4155 RepID=A0A022Q0A3_ERYGU|nr:hypothetical protein MIMGU_mgv1a023000mg [Erythranthe guttata]
MELQAEVHDLMCKTPRQDRYKIPAAAVCPAAPRKKAAAAVCIIAPKDGYFRPPDLEVFFAVASRRRGAESFS